jgi:hypothetical protein
VKGIHPDQLDAARRDAQQITSRLADTLSDLDPDRQWSGLRTAPLTDDARLLIALAVTTTEQCPHLIDSGPQPALCMLAVHSSDCLPCSRTWRWPPLDEAEQCDWCRAGAIQNFTPVVIQIGPLVVAGDACPDCAPILLAGEVAA